jgi:PTH1 family peptidyl-tRNA hydrolase
LLNFLNQHPESVWEKQSLLLAQTARINLENHQVILALPLVFMNESGKTIKALLKNLKIPLRRCLVIHDDTDLPLGKTKLALASRSAGHHGIESIFTILKTHELPRIRIGVRQPRQQNRAETFILKKFTPSQRKIITEQIYPQTEKIMAAFILKTNS